MRNPILIELTRGALVESAHAGVVAVARADGELVAAVGDVAAPIFPRSAIKPLQALPFVESGRGRALRPRDRPRSPSPAARIRARRGMWRWSRACWRAPGLTPAALGCGVHEPFDAAAARAADPQRRSGRPACITTARASMPPCWRRPRTWASRPRAIGGPTTPCRCASARVLEDLTGCSLERGGVRHRRLLGAELGDPACRPRPRLCALRDGRRLDTASGPAIARASCEACTAHPDLVAGPGRFDTLVMQRLPGKVLVKTRRGGRLLRRACRTWASASPSRSRMAPSAHPRRSRRRSSRVSIPRRARWRPMPSLRNWRGLDVGRVRATPELQAVLAALG